MNIILFDTKARTRLFPLTATKAVADVRMGILTIKERWEKTAGSKVFVLTDYYLQPLYETIPPDDYLLIDAGILPSQEIIQRTMKLPEGEGISDENGLIAGRASINSSPSIDELTGLFKDVSLIPSVRRLMFPWQIFQWNKEMINSDYELITKGRISDDHNDSVQLTKASQIFIEEGAQIDFSNLNATSGPIYIGKNCAVMEGCFIRGPFALCEGAVLKMGSKIYGATTIGPWCTAGGEIKNSVMTGYSNKAHDGYLGDSVIGEWCNLGAGTSNSNLKNTGGEINVWNYYENDYERAGNKCGVIMGDYSRTSINTSINTGTVIGVCCNVFGEGLTPKIINDFSWGAKGQSLYEFEKALKDISNWKKMKNKMMSEPETKILKHIFENYKLQTPERAFSTPDNRGQAGMAKNILTTQITGKIFTKMRTQIAAANWKMNLTLQEAQALLNNVLPHCRNLGDNQKVVFAIPAPYLTMARDKIGNTTNVFAAAQNVYSKKSGAFTGELSVTMLKSIGVNYVVIGHSERREYFNENNQFLTDKVNVCLEENITPIFCCGEALPVREVNQQNSFVTRQLEESLFTLPGEQIEKIVIAYEPIWAIGTGKTASSDQAQEMHAHIRKQIALNYGESVADNMSILYGGSVKASNAKEIFGKPDVDGGLVGGSSLVADEFVQIIKALKQ